MVNPSLKPRFLRFFFFGGQTKYCNYSILQMKRALSFDNWQSSPDRTTSEKIWSIFYGNAFTKSLARSKQLVHSKSLLASHSVDMREIVHLQAGQCGNQIGAKVKMIRVLLCSLGKNSFFFHSNFSLISLRSAVLQFCMYFILSQALRWFYGRK